MKVGSDPCGENGLRIQTVPGFRTKKAAGCYHAKAPGSPKPPAPKDGHLYYTTDPRDVKRNFRSAGTAQDKSPESLTNVPCLSIMTTHIRCCASLDASLNSDCTRCCPIARRRGRWLRLRKMTRETFAITAAVLLTQSSCSSRPRTGRKGNSASNVFLVKERNKE